MGRPLAVGSQPSLRRRRVRRVDGARSNTSRARACLRGGRDGRPHRRGALPPLGRAVATRRTHDTPTSTPPWRTGRSGRRWCAGTVPGHLPGSSAGSPATTHGSIVIPFRDQPRFLRTCVDSVARHDTRTSTSSSCSSTTGRPIPRRRRSLEHLAARPGRPRPRRPAPLQLGQPEQRRRPRAPGARCSCSSTTTSRRTRTGGCPPSCAQALRPDVAAVGARLLYPDRRLQHCGLVVGLTGAAGHPLAGLPDEATRAISTWPRSTRECSAVTGACLATRREVFDELGGLRRDARRRPQRRRLLPARRAARATGPSTSRRRAGPPRVAEPGHGRRGRRHRQLRRPVEGLHCPGDPYFNPHLTRADASCGLARG